MQHKDICLDCGSYQCSKDHSETIVRGRTFNHRDGMSELKKFEEDLAMPTPQSPTPTPMVMDAQAVFKLCQDHAALQAENVELREALAGIIEIGKRDMTNPKYNGYFEAAKQALARPPEVK